MTAAFKAGQSAQARTLGYEENISPTIPAAPSGSTRAPTAIYDRDILAENTACTVDPKPDGPRYAACGDAVTVNVAHWIGLRLARMGQ